MHSIPYNVWNKWDPIKEAIVGSCVNENYFENVKNVEIREKLTRLLIETQEDLDNFANVLAQHGAKVYRPFVDSDKRMNPDKKQKRLDMITVQPRDEIGVLGNNIYFSSVVGGEQRMPSVELYQKTLGAQNIINKSSSPWVQLLRKKIYVELPSWTIVGKDIFLDGNDPVNSNMAQKIQDFIARWLPDINVHVLDIGAHNDGCFHTCKPGVIISLKEVQNYSKTFPNWEVLYLPDAWWNTMEDFIKAKANTKGKYWLPGEENNQGLLNFINLWLEDWLGYSEETVFDVNMFMINETTVCVSNYNKDVFDYFKKHKIDPIIVPLRHRFFWDGGLHCCSVDLVREGDQQSYI